MTRQSNKLFLSLRKLRYQTDGFTIVELLFATTVFSLILLMATAGIIQVGRMYFKGYASARTQSITRQVTDDLARPLQFSGSLPVIVPTPTVFGSGSNTVEVRAFCMGVNRFSYALDAQVNDDVSYEGATRRIRHALWRDTLANSSSPCLPLDITQESPDDAHNVDDSGESLLAVNMRLVRLDIARLAADSSLYSVVVRILYGDEDLLECDTKNPGDMTGPVIGARPCTYSEPGEVADRTTARCQGGFVGAQFCAVAELQATVGRRLH